MQTQHIAELILSGFKKHYTLFQDITAKVPNTFAKQDWQAITDLSRLRINHYDERVNETTLTLKNKFNIKTLHEPRWLEVKKTYEDLLSFHPQAELAETYFNSVFCRLFHRQYYNNNFIFVETSLKEAPSQSIESEYKSYFPVVDGLHNTLTNILNSFHFETHFFHLKRDVILLVHAFYTQSPDTHQQPWQMRFDILKAPLYRNKAAYIVGRVISKTGVQPFIIAVLHDGNKGLYLDVLLTQSSQMSVVFGFARAYFMVETNAPSALVRFLKQLMPNKTLAELYSAVGFHKQGKTEFYREFLQHLTNSHDQFDIASGTSGMVMMVFTLPSFDYVFKVIKDKFGESKPFGRNTVLARYQLVKTHDRVGRMADTIQYSNVVFPLARFNSTLLTQLKNTIADSMKIEGDFIIIKHLYIERQMTPLNLYLQTANSDQTKAAITEYGQALKEMIAVNIFPGDMLLKNFGVSKHKRVIFYDYDEVQYLTDMNFRKMPIVQNYDDYLASEESDSVAPQDVFSEQLCKFVLPINEHKEHLLNSHPELIEVEFYKKAQTNIRNKHKSHISPYPDTQRFMHNW
jgi:isocitrate dehydrogenase kinase/phosphatase